MGARSSLLLAVSLASGLAPTTPLAQSPVAGAPPAASNAAAPLLPPGRLLDTRPDSSRAAFLSAHDALIELDWARAANGFARASAMDSGLYLARAYELTLRGRSSERAAEIDRLRTLDGAPGIVEALLFESARDRQLGRAANANLMLNAAARSAPAEERIAAEYHLTLPPGASARVGIARALRDRAPSSYRNQAYVALALAAADSLEAIRASEEAVRLGPTRPFAHRAAGELAMRRGRFDEAAAHYTRALDLDPAYHQALIDRAQVALYAGRPAEARRDLELLLARGISAGDSGLALRASAITWLHERDVERAAREMTAALRRMPASADWRTQRALAHRHLAMMAALRKDARGVEQHVAEESRIRGGEGVGLGEYWTVLSWSFAGDPVRARQALTRLEKMIERGDDTRSPPQLAAVRSTVLMAEKRPEEALAAAGTSTNHFALIAGYQALTALGRATEAQERLGRLFGGRDYALDVLGLAVARYLYGAPGGHSVGDRGTR